MVYKKINVSPLELALKEQENITMRFLLSKRVTDNNKYYFEKCIAVCESVKGLSPAWHLNLPAARENTVTRTRQGSNLHVPGAKTAWRHGHCCVWAKF